MMDLRSRIANLRKESNVREADGRSRYGRELQAGSGGGKTQPGSGRDRPDEDDGAGESSSGALGKDPGEAVERDLCSGAGQAGRDTQGERRNQDIGNPDGTGPVHPAATAAGNDADLGADVQRAQLRIPARAQRTESHAGRAAERRRGEDMGGGHRYHEVLGSCSILPSGY